MNDRYLRHEPCPACGSRDNLARYASGSAYCFGCGYTEKSSKSLYLMEDNSNPPSKLVLPDDCCTQYTEEMIRWCSKYGITVPELLKNNVFCSPGWNQLIFTFYTDEGLVLWQGRNFDEQLKKKRKYYTQGDVQKTFPIYYSGTTERTLVLVEDCISAMKIARYYDAMPCLSSDLSRNKLANLRHFYDNIVVWLDGNMYNKAQGLSKAAQMLGFGSSAIWTALDPKEYDDNEILETIKKQQELYQ